MAKTVAYRSEKSDPCPECGRIFSRQDGLLRHQRVHEAAKNRNIFRLSGTRLRACQACRNARARCTGVFPCQRCEARNLDCEDRRASMSTLQGSGSMLEAIQDRNEDSAISPTDTLNDAPNAGSPTTISRQNTTQSFDDLRPTTSHDVEFSSLMRMNSHSSRQATSPLPLSALRPPIIDIHFRICRYPVLEPLADLLDIHIRLELCCQLLDVYYKSSFQTRLHPACHHIHSFILRRDDVLHPSRPRQTHPALLASMLFTACYSDESQALFESAAQKEQCAYDLAWLSFALLRPDQLDSRMNMAHLGIEDSYVPPMAWTRLHNSIRMLVSEGNRDELLYTWETDKLIAYIHVNSVISASEQKAASIAWWQAVFGLARQLHLNEEVSEGQQGFDKPLECQCAASSVVSSHRPFITEVHREERRRTFWLLYLMDRHLALCYNLKLLFSENECRLMLLPMDDVAWQTGVEPHSHSLVSGGPHCFAQPDSERRLSGPPTQATGLSLFEFYLPLMNITGHLLELYHFKTSPEASSQDILPFIVMENQIQSELNDYQSSIDALQLDLRPATSPYDHPDITIEQYSKTVHSYGSFVVLVIRILLCGKWDPVFIFEDADFWTSSEEFKQSLAHSMHAVSHIQTILTVDPLIRFMPYFFGIQLLHGSWVLMLVAYRLKHDSGAAVLSACETVLQATENCVLTLGTEYQRHFGNIMRTAIDLARGQISVDESVVEKQISAVLRQYRWSSSGGGLARK